MAGDEPDISHFQEVKDAVSDIPIFLNTGAKPENIESYLKIADGVIVGSSLKEDGHTWNKVDPARVSRFMEAVQRARDNAEEVR
jgi:predicted TIM-barrel enzyme